jgi:hypothetical protein
MLSERHRALDELSKYRNKLSNMQHFLRIKRKERLNAYVSTNKMNHDKYVSSLELETNINGDLSSIIAKIDLIHNYIDWLKEIIKNFDGISFLIKYQLDHYDISK